MITYKYEEEKIVALFFAKLLNDKKAESILNNGAVTSSEDATYISKFFWKMVDESVNNKNLELPCEGSAQYWTEKIYNTIGGHLERAGYEKEWDIEIDNA